MKKISVASFLIGSVIITSCHHKVNREFQTYTLNDTVYAMVSQGDTQFYFGADNDLPEGAVALAPGLCGDSLKKVPLLYFNSTIPLLLPSSDGDVANSINNTLLQLVAEGNCYTDANDWPKVFRPGIHPDTMLTLLHEGLKEQAFKAIQGMPYISPNSFVVRGEMSLLSDNLLTYQLNFFQYASGAAHGYYSTVNKVFDMETGTVQNESDIFDITPANVAAVNKLLQETFAELRANDTSHRYGVESGWMTDSMVMNGNFDIVKDGIVYHYNPYQVGSYADGALDLKIHSDKLEPYLRKKSVVYKYWHR